MTHHWPLIITGPAHVAFLVGWELQWLCKRPGLLVRFLPQQMREMGLAGTGGGGSQAFLTLQRWDDMNSQTWCGCFDVHFPTIEPAHAAHTEGWSDRGWGQLQEAGGKNRAASSLPWCEFATSPLQAVTTTATRTVTLRMKWVQGPTSKGSSCCPHGSPSARLHSKFVVSQQICG